MEKEGWGKHGNVIGVVVFIVLIALIGWVENAQPLGLDFADLTGGIVTMDTMVRIGILTIVLVGLNLLMGYAGQISLGQAAFYALGAYASAIMATRATRLGLPKELSSAWWWHWVVMLAGMLATGAFAYLIGKPILRLRGHYLAMGTLGMGVVVYILFREGGLFTGGSDGIHSIPRLAVGNFEIWPIQRYYFLVWALALVVIVLSLNIVNSRVGRALRSIHGSEVAANTMGVDTAKYKLQVLVVSAMYASLAGSLYAHFQAAVSPIPFTFVGSLELVVMSSVGGIASIWGAPFGVTIIYVIREFLRARLHDLLRGAGGEHEVIVYGILLMVIMIFMPEGLTVGLVKALRRARRRAVQQPIKAETSASDSSRTSAS